MSQMRMALMRMMSRPRGIACRTVLMTLAGLTLEDC